MTDIIPLGEVPRNLGELPKKMLAWCIRPDREGDPATAMKLEEVDVPPVGPNEALVLVMGAGVMQSSLWAPTLTNSRPLRSNTNCLSGCALSSSLVPSGSVMRRPGM